MAYRAFQKKDPLGRSVIYITLLFNCFIWPLSAFSGILISNLVNKDLVKIPALILCFSSLWYFNYRYSHKESEIKKINNYKKKRNYIKLLIYFLFDESHRNSKFLKIIEEILLQKLNFLRPFIFYIKIILILL